MVQRKHGRRRARPLARRGVQAIINPALVPDTRGSVVRYAVANGVLWRYYQDGSREQCRNGHHIR